MWDHVGLRDGLARTGLTMIDAPKGQNWWASTFFGMGPWLPVGWVRENDGLQPFPVRDTVSPWEGLARMGFTMVGALRTS